jgi:hypothetical protein
MTIGFNIHIAIKVCRFPLNAKPNYRLVFFNPITPIVFIQKLTEGLKDVFHASILSSLAGFGQAVSNKLAIFLH